MQFHCLLPVRDEDDIIAQCLDQLLEWADAIYVLDTGSIDHTWEIVQEYALREKRVKLLGQNEVYFSEGKTRGYLFHQARKHMRNGDWFLRVDADEFHHIYPPEFVRAQLRPSETIVYHQYYNFQLTQAEAEKLSNSQAIADERKMTIQQRRRYYIPSIYSEPRLCKYRNTMKWPDTVSFPYNAGFVARERLPIRHYPHRDPLQLKRRVALRSIMMLDENNKKNWPGERVFHWYESDWKKFIVPNDEPTMIYWVSETSLPAIRNYNHLASPLKRMVQRIVHAGFLPLLDYTHLNFPEGTVQQPIKEQILEMLKRELTLIH